MLSAVAKALLPALRSVQEFQVLPPSLLWVNQRVVSVLPTPLTAA